jgi:hypothetical protein
MATVGVVLFLENHLTLGSRIRFEVIIIQGLRKLRFGDDIQDNLMEDIS